MQMSVGQEGETMSVYVACSQVEGKCADPAFPGGPI